MHDPGDGDGQQRRACGQREVIRVCDPGKRVVAEEHVARRSAAERGDAAEQANADPVHRPASGGERRRHRLGDDGDDIESLKQHGVPGFLRS